jgi:outer membrane lipoprotein-sorting protein
MTGAWKREHLMISVSVALLIVVACRSQNGSITTEAPSQDTIVSSTPPFQTREPDRYSAVRTITIDNGRGETSVTKTFVARDGDLRRIESDGTAYLDVGEGRFVLSPAEKIYAEVSAGEDEEAPEVSPEGLLHADLGSTSYQKLGAETTGGRQAVKFRIVVNVSGAANVSQVETLMWIDESLHMPIRSETKAADGTRVTMALSELSLDVDRQIFKLPESYQKVSLAEFRKRSAAGASHPS